MRLLLEELRTRRRELRRARCSSAAPPWYQSGVGTGSTSKRKGWKIWWKRSIPLTDTEPSVSPASPMRDEVLPCPRCFRKLVRDLQRDLDRGRAAVRVEDLGEAGRRDSDDAFGELDGRHVREAEKRRVCDTVVAARMASSIAGWRWP